MNKKFDISAKAAALAATVILIVAAASIAAAQSATVLDRNQARPMVPTKFTFDGQTAQTQLRNSGVARFGSKQHVIVGLVDTSGYSTDTSSEYEGFFITDIAVRVGGVRLGRGSYGFGFSKDGRVRFRRVNGKGVFTAKTKNDAGLKRPRPLMLLVVDGELRFYKGRTYAVVKAA